MADISKAQQRQKGKASNKAQYSGNFMRGIKNKLRRLRTRVKHHPDDLVALGALNYWERDGQRTRKGTKISVKAASKAQS